MMYQKILCKLSIYYLNEKLITKVIDILKFDNKGQKSKRPRSRNESSEIFNHILLESPV